MKLVRVRSFVSGPNHCSLFVFDQKMYQVQFFLLISGLALKICCLYYVCIFFLFTSSCFLCLYPSVLICQTLPRFTFSALYFPSLSCTLRIYPAKFFLFSYLQFTSFALHYQPLFSFLRSYPLLCAPLDISCPTLSIVAFFSTLITSVSLSSLPSLSTKGN